jgi:A/G-specific adenine glycosylase
MTSTKELAKDLVFWYLDNARPLPWRSKKDAYSIWLAEVMLQQTTTRAVIPYYERFLKKLPNIESLAKARLSTVYSLWAGLGYYSRARNLHKAAKSIVKLGGFPKTHEELKKLPGFGEYTSRSVASFAFHENVGVLDGNVIRVLTRLYNLNIKWWESGPRKELQTLSDALVQAGSQSATMNHALMELGATICLPESPKCTLCPWHKDCQALKSKTIEAVPIKRPRRQKELWLWTPTLIQAKDGRYFFTNNKVTPFLRDSLLPPGTAKRISSRPKGFHFKHTITHHEIYVRIERRAKSRLANGVWLNDKEALKSSPFSLLKKVFHYA